MTAPDEQMTKAIYYDGYTDGMVQGGLVNFEEDWAKSESRAAHSVIAGKVAEQNEEAVDRIAEAIGAAFERWFSDEGRVSGDELDLRPAIRAALAPYPERTKQCP